MKQIMALMVIMIFGGCRQMEQVKTVTLVKNGQSDHVIVQAAKPTEAEKFAATELANFIKRSTGAELKIVKEDEFKGIRAVYVGQTEFSKKQKIDFAKLGQEEWIIRVVDGNLIISGGRPRGTLYGVYEFLEKCVGVRFPDAYTEYVPVKADLTVPGKIAIQGQPAFSVLRSIEDRTQPFSPKMTLFQARLKLNGRSYGAKLGGNVRDGRPGFCHTFESYAEGLPENPEYWALDKNGKRQKGGDMCQSNPEVRKHFAAKLREFIKLDREEITKAGNGQSFPTIYDISANDGGDGRCCCANCKAVADQYGAYSGLLLEFINYIADDIAKDYPDIIIQTFAYKYTSAPPSGIRPCANVMIRLATLTSDMPADGHEKLRPMEDPVNAVHRARIEAWAKLGSRLGVWTYWEMFQTSTTWPRSMIGCLAPDMRFYRRNGVQAFFTESRPTSFYNFMDLQFYLGAKLMQNPDQDEKTIIDDFMNVYYGKAAPVMREFLDYLEHRQQDDPGRITRIPMADRKTFDRAFFIQTDQLLSKAELLVADNPQHLAHVKKERIPVDRSLLWLWNQLEDSGKLPFNREDIFNRQRDNITGETLVFLRNMPPTPPEFKGKKIKDLTWPLFQQGANASRLTADPDAAGGRALRLDATMKDRGADQHDKLPVFGLYPGQSNEVIKVTLERNKIPADEKYHYYLAGRTRRALDCCVWAHHSWMISPSLHVVANANTPDQAYDVFVSLKLEGPAYVPASTRTNAFSLDRIILVEVDKTNQVITTGGAQ